jgi:ADP-heptose:LPS heptosyltransferase
MTQNDGAKRFPAGTPLNRFFRWNEARLRRDRRYRIAADLYRLMEPCAEDEAAITAGIAHLGRAPAARALVLSLRAASGSGDPGAHAAVFAGFEALAAERDLVGLARGQPPLDLRQPDVSRRILVIKLSALGDFVQALGPAAALRRHHRPDRITLLTTAPYAGLARATRLFDEILIDRRPRVIDIPGWLALRRELRAGLFDRVYDLQTSDRSSFYLRLLWPQRPEWSGIAWGCSHPHADLERDAGHTIDKQAEQLLMAGIHPVPLPACPDSTLPLPTPLVGRRFALLIPGSSARHKAKRWPAGHYGALAQRLDQLGCLPVVIGAADETAIAAAIVARCPAALDLAGKTDLTLLARLAQAATLTIGNDTGVTHLAAAGGNPVVVLFSRASEPARCAPRGRAVAVLQRPDLAELSVDTVLEAALALLAALPTGNDAVQPVA